ncbi:MAG: hypothetical protein ACLRXB_08870 [Escherichia coli]
MPLDVGPQGKQLIELPELPQPEAPDNLANGTRSATNATAWSKPTSAPAAMASGGKPQRDTPPRPRHPQLTTSERILHRAGNSVGNLTASQAFFTDVDWR